MTTPAIIFDHGDVTVTVPADRVLDLIERALAERHVILWGPTRDLSTDEGRAEGALWFLAELTALAHQAGIAALDDGSDIQLRLFGDGQGASRS